MPTRSPRRWNDRARELLQIGPVILAFALLRWADLVSNTPVWVFALGVLATYALSTLVGRVIPDDAPQPKLWIRTGVVVLASTVPMYLTGWGPMLSVGYVALMAEALRASGSRAVRPALTWSLVGLTGGQLLIWAGVFPTMIGQPLVHGAAVLAGLAVLPAALLVLTTTARRERSEETATMLLDLAGALAAAETRREVCQRVAGAVPRLVGVERTVVMLWEPEDKALVCAGFAGFPDDWTAALSDFRIEAGDTPLVDEATSNPRLRSVDIDTVADPVLRGLLERAGTVESFVAPISSRGEVLGFVTAERASGRPVGLSGPLLARLSGLADQAAIALMSARQLEQERETSEQLRIADRTKSEFLAVVSHELRTPLSVMLGAARTLEWRAGELDPQMQADLVESVVRRGEQLNRLVEDLLQASGEVLLEPTNVDLGSLARMAVTDARALSPEVHIAADVGERELLLRADGFRLRQVIDNLIGNATKYAPDGRIAVAAGRSGERTWLTVADDGPGMPAEHLARVFEPFFQADSSAVRKVGGLGLGLHICRRIVEAHGGDITIESAPGQGTCVRVELPVSGPTA
jgi:signal transduction histidine kinase